MDYLLGIDLGTQGVRGALFDLDGRMVATAARSFATAHPRPMWAEQDPETWWQATLAVMRETMTRAGVPSTAVRALSYDCASCNVVALDAAGRPLRPALLWMDERAHEAAATLTRLGSAHFRYCGGILSPQWMLPKALWLKQREPDTYARAAWLVEATDLLTHRLTGEWTASLDNATAKWNYVRALGGWPLEVLKAAGLEDLPDKWPRRVLPVGAVVGPLHPAVADATGLTPATLVAQGGVDAHAGMIGLGAIDRRRPGARRGIVHLPHGAHGRRRSSPTSGDPTRMRSPTAPSSSRAGRRRPAASCSGSSDSPVLPPTTPPGGRGPSPRWRPRPASVPAGADGLLVLDHFQGNRTPHKDPHARGAFVGLQLGHSRAHLLRSVYEGVAFGTRAVLDNLAGHGFALRRLVAGGGGARSPLWMQIHADVLQRPIDLPEAAGADGARRGDLGRPGGRELPRLPGGRPPDGPRPRGRPRRRRPPRPAYDFYYARYQEAYQCLRDLEHRVAAYTRRRARLPLEAEVDRAPDRGLPAGHPARQAEPVAEMADARERDPGLPDRGKGGALVDPRDPVGRDLDLACQGGLGAIESPPP